MSREWTLLCCSHPLRISLNECRFSPQPTPVLLPGKSHWRRSLVGCSPRSHEELNTNERLQFHFSPSCIGEGNGNPLQCSCLENPRYGGAWWAAVYGAAQSRTRLKQLSSSSSSSSSSISAHGPWATILNHRAGHRDSAHSPQSWGVGEAILNQGVSSEGLAARLLHETPCEQVKLGSAQRERKKVTLYFIIQILILLPGNCLWALLVTVSFQLSLLEY